MSTRNLLFVAVVSTLSALTTDSWSKSQTTTVDAANVVSRAAHDRGSVHVFAIEIPADIIGKRLDAALLEFQIDIALAEEKPREATPIIAVYPLAEPLLPGQPPVFTSSFASARNVSPEDRQAILVDITDIVRGWLRDPASNRGLILGSFTGAKLSKLDLKPDAIDAGQVARVTFFYQNRFGDRLSARQK